MLAVILAGAASAQTTAPEMVPVVVTARFLSPGTVVAPEDVLTVVLPADFVPDATFRDVSQVLGRTLREPMPPHVMVRAERLADPEISGVDALIPRGMRRVRLSLPVASSSPEPWDFVDVIRIDGDRSCLLVEATTVVAAEHADGTLTSELFEGSDVYVAIHVAIMPEDAGPVATLVPEETAVWVRNPIDVTRGEGVPRCD